MLIDPLQHLQNKVCYCQEFYILYGMVYRLRLRIQQLLLMQLEALFLVLTKLHLTLLKIFVETYCLFFKFYILSNLTIGIQKMFVF